MYEFGRPRRLSVGEAEALEEQWRAFAPWADGRLQRSGRCHESEIQKVLRREVPLFSRSEQGPADGAAVATLRWVGVVGGAFVCGVGGRGRMHCWHPNHEPECPQCSEAIVPPPPPSLTPRASPPASPLPTPHACGLQGSCAELEP